ncbi:hypothetical protein [Butyrivibrio sp. VCD2006]|uniref:hypothetical protein n=1 Tax=Butyrivibrio sp. VCD2006 TaxID=1280664 RepID=UPI00040D0F74|nr:hypothetical protein [Butyrivibrio sp. VCD2006]
MKSNKNWGKFIVSLGIIIVLLAGCGNESIPDPASSEPVTSEDTSPEPAPTGQVASGDTSTESATAEPVASEDTSPESTPADPIASEDISLEPTPKASAENNSLIKHHSTEHEYNHGKDGYYNLLDDGVEFELTAQLDGTCWVYASACSMMTSYQLDHDGVVVLDQIDLLNEIYSDDKEEGIFTVNGANKKSVGGEGLFVINELANGFGDGFVLDGAIDARNWTIDAVKEGIRKYGALYIGIPDPSNKKGTYDNYYTLNCPTP